MSLAELWYAPPQGPAVATSDEASIHCHVEKQMDTVHVDTQTDGYCSAEAERRRRVS
jgi:hypothetical protein